jgi:tetrahydromethanopterin S-methyltransferase subunit B
MMMVVWEILIVMVASAAIVAAVGGLVYLVVLAGLEERARHLHKVANAQARLARTQSQLPPHESIGSVPMFAGHAKA